MFTELYFIYCDNSDVLKKDTVVFINEKVAVVYIEQFDLEVYLN